MSKWFKKRRKQNQQRKKEIDESISTMLSIDRERMKTTINILILGTGESGKSTFMKQISILYKEGFKSSDRTLYKKTIRENLIKHIKMLINICFDLDLPLSEETIDLSSKIQNNSLIFTDNIGEILELIWKDPAVKLAFRRRSKYQVPDSTLFFLDNISRLRKENYSPTDQDIVLCRIPTTGVTTVEFSINTYTWHLMDVGGQRSERRKWIHQFDNVDTIIYIVALSEYNQILYEDPSENRMIESLNVFNKVVNTQLTNIRIIILYNKFDIFVEKLSSGMDLTLCFPEYTGTNDPIECLNFIQNKFLDLIPGRTVKEYVCTAIDTESMQSVIEEMNSALFVEHLQTLNKVI